MSLLLPLLITCTFFSLEVESAGILYPRASESRQIVSLNGLWDFTVDDPLARSRGYIEKWYEKDFQANDQLNVQLMPVPASYNDVSANDILRDHVGLVWYQRKFFVPKSWSDQTVWVRFSSVCRDAEVWINGESVAKHSIGHLPFQADITSVVNLTGENVITVSVDSTLLANTVPQGSLSTLVSGRVKNGYTFDFFNYGGIDRPVVLYNTPSTYIDDITINTDIDGNNGVVNYQISFIGSGSAGTTVSLIDKSGTVVASNTAQSGTLPVPNANLWWPYLMDANSGYLYQLQIQLLDIDGNIIDKYTQPVGIRKLTWDSNSFNINGKPVYLRGFGRHEDSDIRGKGLDIVMTLRDYNLMKWVGANSYRTSHYPYSEEIMDLADELGIMIIDETPAVNTENYSDELLTNHKQSITELIQRDKNRPAVVIWSAANEPRTQYVESEDYYRQVTAHIRSLDQSRPLTVVNYISADEDHSGQFIDIACVNLYSAWYTDNGETDIIVDSVTNVVRRWNELHNIPVMLTEYGADTQEGLHMLPEYVWSEEYQDVFHQRYWEGFDQVRKEGYFIGEHMWNFADFKTGQSVTRVGGNKKGMFTRNRQPKSLAHLIRKRFWALAQDLDGAEVPEDLNEYIYETNGTK